LIDFGVEVCSVRRRKRSRKNFFGGGGETGGETGGEDLADLLKFFK
jgi:hypothetical protein